MKSCFQFWKWEYYLTGNRTIYKHYLIYLKKVIELSTSNFSTDIDVYLNLDKRKKREYNETINILEVYENFLEGVYNINMNNGDNTVSQ